MKILLPIEDTTRCSDVLERVLAQPWPAGSEFKLITVLEPLEQILPGPDPQYIPHARIVRQEMVDAANLFLRKSAARLEARFVPGTVRFEVLEGLVADRIVAVASEWSADLIVIASHGRKGLSKMLLGSVAETVVLRAPCSVEVVHPEPAGTLAAGKGCQPQTVLIAIDTSECASHVVNEVLRRSWPDTCSFKILTVSKSLYAADISESGLGALEQLYEIEQSEKAARKMLDETAGELKAAFGEARVTSELLNGDIKSTILKEAGRCSANLIVVGSHGRKGLALCMLGSISLGVLEGAPCSVLVVRPAGRDSVSPSLPSGHKQSVSFSG